MLTKIRSWNIHVKISLFTGVFLLLGAAIFAILWLAYGWMDLFFGWLLGGLISLINYGLIILQSLSLRKATATAGLQSIGFYLSRYLIYGLGLAGAIILQRNGYPYFNIFTVFAGYLPIRLMIYLFGIFDKKEVK